MTDVAYMLAAGGWLKRQRKLLGLTQGDVAEAIAVSVSSVSHWERGKHEMGGRDGRALRVFFKKQWAAREQKSEGSSSHAQ